MFGEQNGYQSNPFDLLIIINAIGGGKYFSVRYRTQIRPTQLPFHLTIN